MSKNWYKNTVIYSLDVEAYKDSNGDGVGDFTGLTSSLTYLSGLGITCLWLLPFYVTPNKDNGYDISDYYHIDPRLGNLGDFVELLDAAQELNIRVIIDLVVNHTSDQHPWFQEARQNKNSKFRDYYIWIKEKPEETDPKLIFGDQQEGNWEYDEKAEAYYYHTFYKHQPDLNITNPEVQKEIKKIMHFWLKLGVAGFRMDAVPHMLREKGNEHFEYDPFQVLIDLRDFVEELRNDALLLAEVDTDPQKYEDYFGNGKKMHMLFNFYLNNYMYLAFAEKKAAPIRRALQELPRTTDREQMGIFLRNHDELDLERLTHEERERVFKAFAPSKEMRIFDRGIRRRLPPMLHNDRRRMELAYSLMFSLPGTPVMRYGQEIGMGEDLSLHGRSSVRTVMQWSSEQNGGFSTAPSDKLVRPVISEGEFGYKQVNVNDQRRDPHSFLNWMERLIRIRKICPEIGWGDYKILDTQHEGVLMHYFQQNNSKVLLVHNFSSEECSVNITLEEEEDVSPWIDLFGDKKYQSFDRRTKVLEIGGYGYRWLRKNT